MGALRGLASAAALATLLVAPPALLKGNDIKRPESAIRSEVGKPSPGPGILEKWPVNGMAGDAVARWHGQIAEASARFGVPVRWIVHVMRAESGGQPLWHGTPITSRAGAMGLMQLMPVTWQAMRAALGLGRNPHDPRDNILAGTAYLRMMYDRFGYPGLFGAYNAGPGRYQDHLSSGRPLPAETRNYLAKLTSSPSSFPDNQPAASASIGDRESKARHILGRPTLFITLRAGMAAAGDRPGDAWPASPGSDHLLRDYLWPDDTRARLFAVRKAP